MRQTLAIAAFTLAAALGCGSSTNLASSANSSSSGVGASGGAGGMNASVASGGAGGAMVGAGGSGNGGAGGTGGAGGAGELFSYQTISFQDVPFELPEWVGTTRSLKLFDNAMAFQAYFGVPAPQAIIWATQSVLFYTEGALPFPGHIASVQALALREDGAELKVDTQLRSPGSGCEVLKWNPPAYQLVVFDKLKGSPSLSENHASSDFNCALNGAADGNPCDEQNLCGASLICSQLTRFSPGFCRPLSMYGVFADSLISPIKDNQPTGVLRQINASGLASVDTDVIVKIELDHPDWSQLTITLTNPSNNEVPVWTKETAPPTATTLHRVPKGFSGDESVNGTWTLKIVDDVSGQVGTLKGWELEIVSRLD